MPKIPDKVIYLNKKLIASAKKENIILSGDLTWLTEELRKGGSNITHRVLVDLYKWEHFCPAIYKREVAMIEDYISSKRTLIRKFKNKLKQLSDATKPV